MDPPRRDRLDALWQVLGTVVTGAIVIGAFGALAGWSPAAWILVALGISVVLFKLAADIFDRRRENLGLTSQRS